MADLHKRMDREKELMSLLLIFWQSDSMLFWLGMAPSVRRSAQRINQLGITELADRVARRQLDDFLSEIEWDEDPSVLLDRIHIVGERYEFDLAQRFAYSHREWLVKREIARRTGEPIPEMEEIYTETQAEREAISSLTDMVSETELMSRDHLATFYGVEFETYWRLDPHSNWCKTCLGLSDTPERIWSRRFPRGPKAHPNCRCYLETVQVYPSSDEPLPDRRFGQIVDQPLFFSL